MIYLLDTNVISEISKPKPHGAVLAWFQAQSSFAYAIPAIALYEIQAGIERARNQHPQRAATLQTSTDELMRAAIILPLDGSAARETARIMHGKSLDLLEDAMIAAIAKTNRLTVVTRNTKHFATFGIDLLNPFLFESP